MEVLDILPNFSFTTSETKSNEFNRQGAYELLHKLPNNLTLRILGNKEKSGKSQNLLRW